MQYDGDLKLPEHFLVDPPQIDTPLGALFVQEGLTTLACSETQKFGHVTYFFNGNRSGYFDEKLESYLEIPSDNLPFDQRPWMKAAEITDAVISRLDKAYDHIRINYANGDMVGHTGNLSAARLAVETVDLCLGRLIPAVLKHRGMLLITADHGNADEMLTMKQGEKTVVTSHSLNPVPCYFATPPDISLIINEKVKNASLANVAASLCFFLGYRVPKDYAPSLII
jgi:2,3-bisphosphoglycerate-independent phosphoglycerate mutase